MLSPVDDRLHLLGLSEYLELPPPLIERLLDHSYLPDEQAGGFWNFDRDEVDVVSWNLCLALRRAGMLSAQPNRPYLDRRGMRLAQQLLEGTGVRARTVRDWEAALMLEADSRLSRGATLTKLDAEIVTVVCAQLSHSNPPPVPTSHS